jgi:DNA-binding HxlR family transcriptional regulator
MTNSRRIDKVTGRSPDVRIMLYLLEKEPIGIRAMWDDEVASTAALSRSLRDLIIFGLVEIDLSSHRAGRPYKLTKAGRSVALMLLAAEAEIPRTRAPPS